MGGQGARLIQLHVSTFYLYFYLACSVRISNHQSEKDTFSCSLCGGSRILLPLQKVVAVLPWLLDRGPLGLPQ